MSTFSNLSIFKKGLRKTIDRRTKVDPRFRNPSYPEFVDRRSGQDRRGVPEDERSPILTDPHHHEQMSLWAIGVAGVAVILILLVILMFHLRDAGDEMSRQPKKSVNPIVSF